MSYGDPWPARDADLRRWRDQFPDVVPIAGLPRRQQATCVGVVHTIRFLPGRGLECLVADGSGELELVWSGRSILPGVELGSGVRVTGTVGTGTDGRPVMRNPDWSLVSEPYR